ncbi:MAG: hypothetical protein IIW31_05510 [Clostridia bacterium]|nr:hypothetical protein [Clostridia bacterium]
MKQKTFVPLMEQICMICIFALAAALCLQGFALANKISEDRHAKDCALISAQNAAEILKEYKGDLSAASQVLCGTIENGAMTVRYDADGRVTQDAANMSFVLTAQPLKSTQTGLGTARIYVTHNGEIIFEITTGWQE